MLDAHDWEILLIYYLLLTILDPRLRHSGTSLTGLIGVYLLIRKRAVLRYIRCLLAVYVSLLATKGQANIRIF